MKKVTITFEREQVVNYLMRLIHIIPKRPVLPINEYYMFKVENGSCKIFASDANMTVTCSVSVECDEENFSFCIPAALFTDTIKLLHEPAFTLTVAENACMLKSGKSRYKMPTESANNFVMIEEGESKNEVSVHGQDLRSSFRIATAFINPKVDNNLRNVNMHVKGNNFIIVGGKTILISRHTISPRSLNTFDSISIPLSIANVIKLMFSEKDIVDILHDGRVAVFDNGTYRINCTTFNGKFPSVEKMLQREKDMPYIKLHTQYFLEALKRIILYSPEGTYGCIFDITKGEESGNMRITADNNDFGRSGEENIEVVSSVDFTVALPCHEVISILGNLFDSEVLNYEFIRMYIPETHKMPIIITDDNDVASKEFLISPLMVTK